MLVHLFVHGGVQIFALLFKPKGDPFHLCKRLKLLSQRLASLVMQMNEYNLMHYNKLIQPGSDVFFNFYLPDVSHHIISFVPEGRFDAESNRRGKLRIKGKECGEYDFTVVPCICAKFIAKILFC